MLQDPMTPPHPRSAFARLVSRTASVLCFAATVLQGPGADAVIPDGQAPAPTPIDGPGVKALELETVGTFAARAWYRLLPPGRADDKSGWKQLVWFKRDSRTVRKSWFASLDFATGQLKEQPMIPCMEPWDTLWVGGKLYIGMNLMPRLAVYDPATDTLTDVGEPFTKSYSVFRLAVGPDGVLALGAGSGTDLATYDPATKTFTSYGQVGGAGTEQGYVYWLSLDLDYIYCAVRGTGPWELVAIHRKTRERTVLATAPVDTMMTIDGNRASVPTGKGDAPTRYLLAGGKATPLDAAAATDAPKLPGPGFSGEPPKLVLDESPLAAGESSLKLHFEKPGATPRWQQTTLEVVLDQGVLGHVVAVGGGRIAAIGRAYEPMVVTDLKGGRSWRVPMPTSAYTLAAAGNRVFVAGYPSANLMLYDADKPLTWTVDLPDQPGVPLASEQANPRQAHVFASETGGAHIGACLTPAADGRIYLIARRHRYFYGFALAWFNPTTLETGVVKDGGAFDHLQIGWMAPVDGGRKLAISTYVEPNKQLSGVPPEGAALLLFDVKEQRIVGKYTPLPGTKVLLGVAETAPGWLVGVGVDEEKGTSTVYRFNLETGATEQARVYAGLICGKTGTLGVPLRTHDFRLGPDGRVWSGVDRGGEGTVLFRLNPADLGADPVGFVEGSYIRLLFDGGRVYLSGASSVRRVKNLTVGPSPQR